MGWAVSGTPRPRFTPGKGPLIPTEQEAGWAPEPVRSQWQEEKSFFLCRESNLDRLVIQSVARHHTAWATRLILWYCTFSKGIMTNVRAHCCLVMRCSVHGDTAVKSCLCKSCSHSYTSCVVSAAGRTQTVSRVCGYSRRGHKLQRCGNLWYILLLITPKETVLHTSQLHWRVKYHFPQEWPLQTYIW
jgi:hypothetical protein